MQDQERAGDHEGPAVIRVFAECKLPVDALLDTFKSKDEQIMAEWKWVASRTAALLCASLTCACAPAACARLQPIRRRGHAHRPLLAASDLLAAVALSAARLFGALH